MNRAARVASFPVAAALTSIAVAAAAQGDLNSVPALACKAAIAQEAGVSEDDVALVALEVSRPGINVSATVAGSEDPWTCVADRRGAVMGVLSSGG